MKKAFLFLAAVLFATPALAQQIGPASTNARDMKPNLGIGYTYHESDWGGTEAEQSRAYLHLGVGGGLEGETLYELYLRIGGADLEVESGPMEFDSGYEPFIGAGMKINFLRDELPFGLGLVIQGAYFASWEDEIMGVDVEFEDAWEIEAALPIEYQAGPVIVYAGPLFYRTEVDTVLTGPVGSLEAEEEDDGFGVFGGLAIDVGAVRLEAEVQDKSDTIVSGLITYAF